MAGGVLKTAVCVSVAAHVVGYLVITQVRWPQSSHSIHSPDQPPVLAIITASGTPTEPAPVQAVAKPVQRVLTQMPEIAAVKPPDAETPPVPKKPVAEPVQAEPPPPADPVTLPPAASPTPAAPPMAELPPALPVPEKREAVTAQIATAPSGGDKILARAKPDYRKILSKNYPTAAIRRHEEGQVIVTVLVDAQGRPKTVKLKQSSGHKLLDDAAVNDVRSWEFEPARIGGQAVATEVEVPVDFKLADPRP